MHRQEGVVTQKRERTTASRLEALLESFGSAAGAAAPAARPARLVVRDGERLMFLDINRIEWIESAGNQVRVHAGARSYVMRVTTVPRTSIRTPRSRTGRSRVRWNSSGGPAGMPVSAGSCIRCS